MKVSTKTPKVPMDYAGAAVAVLAEVTRFGTSRHTLRPWPEPGIADREQPVFALPR